MISIPQACGTLGILNVTLSVVKLASFNKNSENNQWTDVRPVLYFS